MHRIDSSTAEADTHGAGKDGFTDGNPGLLIPPTDLTGDIANAWQEELANFAESTGAPLNKADNTQVISALRAYLAGQALENLARRDVDTIAVPLRSVASLASSLGNWCAVGEAGAIQLSQDDGETWINLLSDGPTSEDFNAIVGAVVGGGSPTFLAVGTNGLIQSAIPGWADAWSARTPDGSYSGDFLAVCHFPRIGFGNSMFVAVGTGGEIQTSNTTTSWTQRTSGTSESIVAAAASSQRARVACLTATGGIEVRESTTGASWAVIGSEIVDGGDGGIAPLTGATIVNGGDIWVLVVTTGTDSAIYVAEGDGTFSKVANIPGVKIEGAAWDGQRFLLVSATATFNAENDGTTWYRHSAPHGLLLHAASARIPNGFGNRSFVVVGEDEFGAPIIRQSPCVAIPVALAGL